MSISKADFIKRMKSLREQSRKKTEEKGVLRLDLDGYPYEFRFVDYAFHVYHDFNDGEFSEKEQNRYKPNKPDQYKFDKKVADLLATGLRLYNKDPDDYDTLWLNEVLGDDVSFFKED